MALKVLMMRKSLDEKRNSLMAILEKFDELNKRELDLEKAIEEATTEEEKKVVEESVEAFETEKAEAEETKASLEQEIENLEKELKSEEEAIETPVEQPTEEEVVEEPQPEERGKKVNMETRKFFNLNSQERDMFFAREDVKSYLGEVRNAIKEKRALNNVGLTIPEVFLGLIRENIMDYSKLYKHVWVRNVGGTSRATIMANIPEGKLCLSFINA